MDQTTRCLTIYRELADHYERLGQVSMRDRFLMLAADAALTGGDSTEAERLRQRLLQGSRHHMLRPYGSFDEAVRAPDVEVYLRDLRTNYPLEEAERLLDSVRTSGAGRSAAVDQTQPVDWSRPLQPATDPPIGIPPTAPVVDMHAPARAARLDGLPGSVDSTPSPQRPLAQPIAGRGPSRSGMPVVPTPAPTRPHIPAVRPTGSAPSPSRPAQERPGLPFAPAAAAPVAALAPASMAEPPVTVAASPRRRKDGSAWFSNVLCLITVVVGLALLAFTLARPFLPVAWLP